MENTISKAIQKRMDELFPNLTIEEYRQNPSIYLNIIRQDEELQALYAQYHLR